MKRLVLFSPITYRTQAVFIRILFIVTKNLFSLYFGKPFVLISIFEQCLGSPSGRFLDVAPSGVENFQLTNKEAFFIFLSFARQRKTRIGINEILLCVVDPVVRVLTCLLSLITRYAVSHQVSICHELRAIVKSGRKNSGWKNFCVKRSHENWRNVKKNACYKAILKIQKPSAGILFHHYQLAIRAINSRNPNKHRNLSCKYKAFDNFPAGFF